VCIILDYVDEIAFNPNHCSFFVQSVHERHYHSFPTIKTTTTSTTPTNVLNKTNFESKIETKPNNQNKKFSSLTNTTPLLSSSNLLSNFHNIYSEERKQSEK
jgi:hypothetical protein